jgi:hypothetical protein
MKFAHVTTYNYAENNPVSYNDLYGLQAVPNRFGITSQIDAVYSVESDYNQIGPSNKTRNHLNNTFTTQDIPERFKGNDTIASKSSLKLNTSPNPLPQFKLSKDSLSLNFSPKVEPYNSFKQDVSATMPKVSEYNLKKSIVGTMDAPTPASASGAKIGLTQTAVSSTLGLFNDVTLGSEINNDRSIIKSYMEYDLKNEQLMEERGVEAENVLNDVNTMFGGKDGVSASDVVDATNLIMIDKYGSGVQKNTELNKNTKANVMFSKYQDNLRAKSKSSNAK